jgi:hypothetical protein
MQEVSTMRMNLLGKMCFAAFFPLQMAFIMGCASVKPMNAETIDKYGLFRDFDKFKIYQYFVSRDIVLTSVEIDEQTNISGGQAFSSRQTHRDVLQLLASTAGKCLEYSYDEEAGAFMLGIEFDEGSNNLLWFYYDRDDYFYLNYTDRVKGEIAYAEKIYQVTYEEAKGIGAILKRVTTSKKAKEDYQNREPLLLYEEKVKEKETETRKTLGGSRLQ